MALPTRAQDRRSRLTPQKIIKACRRGARVTRCLGRAEVYILQPPGLRLVPRYAKRAIASGELVPIDDGLFPGNTQTFTAKRDPRPARDVE
jgi:hypothetical protein